MQNEYFIIGRENNNQHPLLIVTKGFYEDDKEYVENPEPMEYQLGAPVPKKPVMVDFHSSPGSVVSQKIHDVLEKLNIKGLQLIPAAIVGNNNERHESYWYINAYNKLGVLDREKSVYKF